MQSSSHSISFPQLLLFLQFFLVTYISCVKQPTLKFNSFPKNNFPWQLEYFMQLNLLSNSQCHYLSNSIEHILLQKLIIAQLTKKFPPFVELYKVHYRVHKGLPQDLILRHSNSFHNLTTCVFKIILILFSYLRLGLPVGLFPSGLLQSKFCMHFSFSHLPETWYNLIWSPK
jgi:hypothetical protein